MAFEQRMQLGQRMAQVQTMSPQMQQSLAMLQAPLLDLRAMINKELQENPVLEETGAEEIATQGEVGADGQPINDREKAEAPIEPPADTQVDPTKENNDELVDDFQVQLERLAELSEEWRDHFNGAQTAPIQRASVDDEERRQFMFDSLTAGVTLQNFLMEQANQSDLDEDETAVAEMIIGNIDDYGYLEATVEELMEATHEDRDMIDEVLCVIRSFEPVGVGARDLRECLLLQLERKGEIDSLEHRVVDQHMEALGRRRFPEIARALGVEVDEVQDVAENIGQLEPRPGRAFLPDSEAMVVMPEIFVNWKDGDYVVTSNREEMPQVRISNDYKDILAGARDAKDVREYIRSKIRDGKFLIKSIQKRHDTILKIAKEIVKRQRAFMDEGVSKLKPMTMSEVAEVVEVHETTVSRAVAGKYMQTPQGLFEMRYFFTSALKTVTGQDVSNASVKQVINDLVENEDKSKPFSDEQIVKILADKDLKIARRTVAKYRGELNILSSNMRRVY